MNKEKFDDIFDNLPPQRKKILELLLKGNKNREIADKLSKKNRKNADKLSSAKEDVGTEKGNKNIEIAKKLSNEKEDVTIGNIAKQISILYDDFECRTRSYERPRETLIRFFYTFKRDLVSPDLRERFARIKIDEYLCNTESFDPLIRQGIDYFNRRKYNESIKLFEIAVDSDPTDPISQIFLNNAKANSLKGIHPLKIAVVISLANNFHIEASNNVLRGIADAQTMFNQNSGQNKRLLEIIIADDRNQPELARTIAKNLSDDRSILGIIGHHSSESTKAALEIYQETKIAIVSPTSTSSQLEHEVFFRTIGSTNEIAAKYASFIKKSLGLDKIAVIYHQYNPYSQVLKDEFKASFEALGGKIIEFKSNINNPILDIELLIEGIECEAKAVLLISSIETSSIALAIAKENSRLNHHKMKLFFTTSLPEISALERGRDSLEDAFFIHPAIEESGYTELAKKRWEQKEINWRVASSYAAAQALVAAIRSSSKNPNRQEVLENLKLLKLPIDSQYCITQIHNNSFVKVC